ncbi:hypothetical protein [Novosphingobium sp.]|uniref:hypothetical protein n=1 Tax=Novosphingobium sp. TaxID=1874826 RepID=UPI0035AE84D8
MQFDSNEAWKEATAKVAANRDMLLAITGVFILLPSFAVQVFTAPLQVPLGNEARPEQVLAAYGAYFEHSWPYLLVMAVLHLIGTLAMIALITDPRRPTVAEAIRTGLGRTGTVGAAMVMLFFALSFVAGLPLNIAALTGSPGIGFLGMAAGLTVLFYGLARTLPLMPVVVVDRVANPLVALRRAYMLSRGNGGRLMLFYGLIFVAFLLSSILLLAGLKIVFTLALSAEATDLLMALADSGISAVMSVYLAAVLAAIHRQLAAGEVGTRVDKAL